MVIDAGDVDDAIRMARPQAGDREVGRLRSTIASVLAELPAELTVHELRELMGDGLS